MDTQRVNEINSLFLQSSTPKPIPVNSNIRSVKKINLFYQSIVNKGRIMNLKSNIKG